VERARFILGDERAIQAVNSFWSLIQQTRKKLKSKQNLVSIVESLIEEIELYQDIWSSSASEQAAAYSWSHVENFLDGLRAYCQSSSAPTLYDYLNQISLNELELDTDNKRGNLVTLSTLHGAKGLEFPIVFLVGLEEGLLPHDRVINPHETDVGSGDLSEELRLCYVGVTRAKDELVLTRAAQRMVRGKLQPRAPSRFISEIKTPCLQIEDRTKTLSPSQARNRLAQIRAMLSEQ